MTFDDHANKYLGFDSLELSQFVEQAGIYSITFETVYTMKLFNGGKENAFRLFLMTARRNP